MRRRSCFVASIAFLTGAACSTDHDGKQLSQDDASATVGDRVEPLADGGASIDGATQVLDIDGAVSLPLADGAVGSISDGSLVDGGVQLDGSSALDGALATGPDGGGACDVVHPVYGCGDLAAQGGWVTFPDGLEIDLVNNVAWTTPVDVYDDDALAALCAAKTTGGLTWKLPQMEDVRQLAAGCPETVPGGSCQVDEHTVTVEEAGDCECDPGARGPNNGKFCRPEVPDCEVLWVWTHSTEVVPGLPYEHWFYDVDTGSISPEQVGINIATRAKGRCVHALTASEMILQ